MRNTLTIRLPEDLAKWLSETARKTGLPQGQIVRSELERARQGSEKPFMRLIGSIEGSPGLSQRKGFSKK
ncbi:MAG: ribbon-helix-helix protein, CopG family [Acidobacteriota bacterium]